MASIHPFGFYLYRQHAQPIDTLFLLNENCKDFIQTEVFLKTLFKEKSLKEAIFISSPTLFERMQQWLQGELISEKEKLIQTLFKYYLRMSSRCTPYGTFAGCSVGNFAENRDFQIDKNSPSNKFIRLDSNYLVEIVNYLISDKRIREQLIFYPNNTIYKISDKFHYLFYTISDHKRSYSVCSIDANEYLCLIIEKNKNGINYKELIEILVAEEIDFSEAEGFIDQLIEEQLLFSEIEPTIYGEDFFDKLITKLSSLKVEEEILVVLKEIQEILSHKNQSLIGLQRLDEILKRIVNKNIPNSLQTVLYFNFKKNTIEKSVIEDLSKKIEKLLVLNLGNYNEELSNFKKKFYARYEEAEVPLTITLDNEIGIGYGNLKSISGNLSLVEDISAPKTNEIQSIYWVFWKEFTTRKYTEALRNNSTEICLTDEDLKELEQKNIEFKTQIPATFQVFGSFFHEKPDYFFQLKNIIGPSGVSLMARFANGNSDLKEKLKLCTVFEESKNPDAIFAEIVHIPESRIGNISTRPQLRQFEIPYQTFSAHPTEKQITVDDLMISVRNDEVILRSKKLNKQIIPCLSSAHDYSTGLNIYRFLCHLQQTNESLNVSWHWHILSKYPFLPKVRYQNIILSPAIWNLSHEFLFQNQSKISSEDLRKIQKEYKIPRFVSLAENDNELWIDFENEVCLSILKDIFLKNKHITLKEILSTPENCFLKTPNRNFTNEVVIPFQNLSYSPKSVSLQSNIPKIQRNFSIGSEWFYLKIYCGEKTADSLLANQIWLLTQELYADGIIEQFFFIRYQDPDFHIRLRFKGNPQSFFYTHVISRLNQVLEPFFSNQLIYKIQSDTYNREIERYGEKTIELSEEFFSKDSHSILEFLNLTDHEEERFAFTLRRIDYYLKIFGVEDKKSFTEKMQQIFLNEFGNSTDLKKLLNQKFKNFDIDISDDHDFFSDIDEVASEIVYKTDNQEVINLLESYIHMTINRAFISENRTYELLIYHFLYKTYSKQLHLLKA